MELERQKNVATIIAFPILDKNGDRISGAANLDSEYSYWADGTTPSSFADLTNEATEIGTTGIYYLQLTATEMNNDYIFILITTTSPNSRDQMILIRTMVGDPLNHATTEAGRQIDVATGGEVGVDFSNINGTLDAAEIGDNAITAAKIATGAIDADAIADNAIDAGAIAADAIGSSEIAANAIGNAEIADNAISAAKIATDAIDNTKIAADAISNSEIAADAIGSSELAASAVQEIADQVWDELLADHVTALTMGANQNLIDDIKTETDKIQTIDDNVDAILADTNEMQGKLPTNNIMGSSVKTDKDDEIDAIKAKTDNLPADPASETNVDATETAILNDHTVMKQKTAGTYNRDTDSLEALSEQIVVIDGNVDDILVDTNEIQGKLPVNDIADQTLIDADLTNIENKIDIIDTNVDDIETEVKTPRIAVTGPGFENINIFTFRPAGVEVGFWAHDVSGNVLVDTGHVSVAGTYLVIRYRPGGNSATYDSGTLSTKNENNTLKFYFTIDLNTGDFQPGDMLFIATQGSRLLISSKTYYLPQRNTLIYLNGDDVVRQSNITGGTASAVNTNLGEADDFYNGMQVLVIQENGLSDNKFVVRNIKDFANTGGVITFDKPIPWTPDTGDRIIILGKVSGSNVPDLDTELSTVETNIISEIDVNETHLTDIKGTGFVKDTDSLVDIRPETDKIQTIDDNVDAIKLKTDNLPADPTSEANATTNTNSIITEVDANETKIDALQTDLTEALSRLLRTLALTNENVVMEHGYDGEDKHTGWTVWCYDSKDNADSHNKSTGLLYTYTMTVTYDINDNPTVTKIVRNP